MDGAATTTVFKTDFFPPDFEYLEPEAWFPSLPNLENINNDDTPSY